MRAPRVRNLLALPLAGLLLAGSVAAQDDPSPAGSAEPDAASEPEPLSGTWRRISAAPFGAVDAPGGWTGTELVIADPAGKRRATSYLPALDSWSNVTKPPRKLLAGSETHWTGSELVFVEPRGTSKRGLTLYDPVADAWRTTAAAPLNEIASSTLAGDTLVVAAATGARTATYDFETDTWTELPVPADVRVRSLHSTGEAAFALALLADAGIGFIPLDLDELAWREPVVGPLTELPAPPLWIGDRFLSLAAPATTEAADPNGATPTPADSGLPPVLGASFDPASGVWAPVENVCGIDTGDAVWAEPPALDDEPADAVDVEASDTLLADGVDPEAGDAVPTEPLVLDVDSNVGFDPATGRCYPLPASPWAQRSGALRVWTGNEVLDVAGVAGGPKTRRDGVAYDPYPGDDPLGVVLDVPSRAVRVRVPSLRIDLPVISDSRKVPGSTRGYPACDVALSWAAFDRPGKPGTAWILAHAQEGMFLPLLETLRAKGKEALLGREVEVQLRDGRVLTYRTYRANARATNTNIGFKGRKDGEHRLVLQTSTGVGSDPKLLVAARLVDIETTDEPRPKPKPRACG